MDFDWLIGLERFLGDSTLIDEYSDSCSQSSLSDLLNIKKQQKWILIWLNIQRCLQGMLSVVYAKNV